MCLPQVLVKPLKQHIMRVNTFIFVKFIIFASSIERRCFSGFQVLSLHLWVGYDVGTLRRLDTATKARHTAVTPPSVNVA